MKIRNFLLLIFLINFITLVIFILYIYQNGWIDWYVNFGFITLLFSTMNVLYQFVSYKDCNCEIEFM